MNTSHSTSEVSVGDTRVSAWEIGNTVWWFLMDVCWMFDSGFLAAAMSIPAVICGIGAVWYAERSWPQKSVGCAMLAWLSMNILWMLEDIHLVHWEYPYKLFACGLAIFALVIAFVTSKTRADFFALLAKHFRRIRLNNR